MRLQERELMKMLHTKVLKVEDGARQEVSLWQISSF